MAKRRKRRARVGSVQDTMVTFAGLFVGSFAGNFAKNHLPEGTSKDIANGGETLLGLAGANFAPHPFLKNVGYGMALDGGTQLAAAAFKKAGNGRVNGSVLNRRPNGIGSENGYGKMNAETSFEIV
jgi:hypothetical protein